MSEYSQHQLRSPMSEYSQRQLRSPMSEYSKRQLRSPMSEYSQRQLRSSMSEFLKTQPLIEKINVLEKVNRQLTNDLDNREQYGRRSLIRISGIPEPVGEVDTTETVRNLISEIGSEYKPTDVIRSHRVGTISQPGSFNSKTRQIIVRLADPSVKMRILRSRKNLRKSRNFKSVYINEEITRTRTKIFYHARQLLKTKQIENLWTTNGKIIMKEVNGTINETNTPEAFRTLVERLAHISTSG